MSAYRTEVLRGAGGIIRARAMLREFAAACGQQEAISDIHYYLDKPGLLSRTPVLVVLRRSMDGAEQVAAAVLLFQYKIAGIPLGVYTSNDRSGRRTVISQPEDRVTMATQAAKYLFDRGANCVMLSLRSDGLAPESTPAHASGDVSWIFRQREIPDYLPLRTTYDETLAHIGKRTRTHMRYYRRRAEDLLHCSFHPELTIDEDELLSFNHQCMYPVSDQVAAWRLRALQYFERPILMGLRDGDGRLLSVLGGRRLGVESDLLWQMNHRDLEGQSLSLAMRTYFIEHEISQQARRVYLDGGSSHSLCHSFARGTITDFAVIRRTPLSFLVRKIARSLIPVDNDLGRLLTEEVNTPVGEPVLRTN